MSTQPGVYETTASSAELAGVRIPGGPRWIKRVSQLFGARYNPNYGWDFAQYGPVDVGTVGVAPVGKTQDLGAEKTVGISAATGKLKWTVRGLFQCGGQVQQHARYICLLTGTAAPTPAGILATSKNATVTLQGFDASTGRITWRMPVTKLTDLLLGNVEIKDDDDLLVHKAHGGRVVLNLNSGTTVPVAANEVFWCAHLNVFKIRPPAGISAERVGPSLYEPCNASGYQVASSAPPPALVSATADHTFVWASISGLQGAHQQ